MRVITLNVNGIRAAARKGFFAWLARARADVVCLQELKAEEYKLADQLFHPQAFHNHYFSAKRPGYSGVGFFSRTEPLRITKGIRHRGCPIWQRFNDEGRYIEATFKNVSIASLYAPSGSHSEERQAFKFEFMEKFAPKLKQKSKRPSIICGDFNIAHKNIDIKNWQGNQKNSGFLPEERAWMDDLFDQWGFVDAFRVIDPREHQYTWWSNRGQAYANNVGWRIDYQVVSKSLENKIRSACIYKTKRFSDHAPLIMDYDISL